jgi:hypothetical protein
MSDKVNKVALVLDPNFGEKLELLAYQSHVWIIDTPHNQAIAIKYWHTHPHDKTETGITTFKFSTDKTLEELCLGMLDTIDLHHGEYSSNPPYSNLEIVGLPKSEALQSALEELGFKVFEPTAAGFRALRI